MEQVALASAEEKRRRQRELTLAALRKEQEAFRKERETEHTSRAVKARRDHTRLLARRIAKRHLRQLKRQQKAEQLTKRRAQAIARKHLKALERSEREAAREAERDRRRRDRFRRFRVSFKTNLRRYLRREIAKNRLGRWALLAYDFTRAWDQRAWTRDRLKRLQRRAITAVFGSKARAVEKMLGLAKKAKRASEADWKEILKRKIKAAVTFEWRKTFTLHPRMLLHVIVRTNLQHVYIGGRLNFQKRQTKKRPYWRYVTRGDERVCPICSPLHGTVFPHDHQWWQTHKPPLHHGCRCTVQALTPAAAKKAGISKTPPKAEPPGKGFGGDPDLARNDPGLPELPGRVRDAAQRGMARNGYYEPGQGPLPESYGGFKPGVHSKRIVTDVTAQDTAHCLAGAQRAGAAGFLKEKPLNFFELGYANGANGWYMPRDRVMVIESWRPAFTRGHAFRPGETWSMSSTGTSERDARQKTFVHELGHHVHLDLPRALPWTKARKEQEEAWDRQNRFIRSAYRRGNPITRYARTSHYEYFAESWTAYVYHPDTLRRHDPVGYAMVEKMRRDNGMSTRSKAKKAPAKKAAAKKPATAREIKERRVRRERAEGKTA